MTQFHRRTQPKTRWLLAFLIGVITVQACNPGVPASTPIPTLQPGSTATPAPSATLALTSVPLNSPTPPNTPTEVTPEAQPGVVVVSTGNPEFATMAVFRAGGLVAAMTETDSAGAVTAVNEVIFLTPEGNSIVMYFEDGLPSRAVLADHLVIFSNYTENTVDLTVVALDGTANTSKSVPFDRGQIHKFKLSLLPNHVEQFHPVGFSAIGLPREADLMWWASTLLGAGGCAMAIASASIHLLADIACALFIYNKYFELTGQEAPLLLKGGGRLISGLNCNLGLFSNNPIEVAKAIIVGCNKFIIDLMREIRKSAAETGEVLAASVSTRSPVRGIVLQKSSCRYGPSQFHLYKTGFKAQAPVKIIGRDADGDWIQIELRGGNTPCWINASLVQVDGDVMALPDTYPPHRRLPISDALAQIALISASPSGKGITASWVHQEIREDLQQTGTVEYIIEVWTCVDEKPAFYAVGTDDTFATFQVDYSCGVASHADLIAQDEHGFSFPTVIPLP